MALRHCFLTLPLIFVLLQERVAVCLVDALDYYGDVLCENDVNDRNVEASWIHRETHHTASNVMVSDNDNSGTSRSSLWVYNPHHVADDDPVNLILRFQPTPFTKAWKYEFSCQSIPKLALSASSTTTTTTTVWALACPSQQVPLYNGETLTSKAGSVSIFAWNSTRRKARIIHTIYGKNTTDQLGTSMAMSSDGTTIALVANRFAGNAGSAKERREQRRQKNEKDPSTVDSYLDVYRRPNDNNKKEWKPLGSTINSITRVSLSDDGTIMAVVTNQKNIKVYRLVEKPTTKETDDEEEEGDSLDWFEERFTTNHLRTESVSSMSLSGNGQTISMLQQMRGGQQVVNIYRRFRTGNNEYKWKFDSAILPPPPPPTTTTGNGPNNKKKRNNKASSFGWVTSLSSNGERIAIAEPSYNGGAGVVRVYGVDDDRTKDDDSKGRRRRTKRNNTKNPSPPPSPPQWKRIGQSILGIHPNRRDSLGRHLHLSRDGNHLIVKALSYTAIYDYHHDDDNSGNKEKKSPQKKKTRRPNPRDEL